MFWGFGRFLCMVNPLYYAAIETGSGEYLTSLMNMMILKMKKGKLHC